MQRLGNFPVFWWTQRRLWWHRLQSHIYMVVDCVECNINIISDVMRKRERERETSSVTYKPSRLFAQRHQQPICIRCACMCAISLSISVRDAFVCAVQQYTTLPSSPSSFIVPSTAGISILLSHSASLAASNGSCGLHVNKPTPCSRNGAKPIVSCALCSPIQYIHSTHILHVCACSSNTRVRGIRMAQKCIFVIYFYVSSLSLYRIFGLCRQMRNANPRIYGAFAQHKQCP